jgi:dihydrofolate reductase
LLDHRLALYGDEQRMVFGANTYRAFARMLASSTEESGVRDPWVTRMRNMPATVVSTTLEGPLDWPNATVVSGDAVDVVARLKEESEGPLHSHGSLSLNRALMAAGLVDRVQLTLFPVITAGEADVARDQVGIVVGAHAGGVLAVSCANQVVIDVVVVEQMRRWRGVRSISGCR